MSHRGGLFFTGVMVFFLAVTTTAATQFPDRLTLVQLLLDTELETLDTLIRGYQGAYEAGAISESQLEAVYFAFANSSADLERNLNRWVSEMPDSFPAHMARGVYFWNLGLLTRGPRTHRGLTAEHDEVFRDHFSQASTDLIEAIDTHRQLGLAYSLLIHMASDLGDGSDIVELVRRGSMADPRSLSVHRRYLDSQRPWITGTDEAVETSMTRIKRYVSNLEPRFASHPELSVLAGYPTLVEADLLARNGERVASIPLYDEAATHGYWIYLYRRGVNHFRLQAFELALMDFDQALVARPQAADVLNMRARALRALDRIQAANVAWTEALALNSRDPKLLFHRAAALRDDGDFEAAAAVLTEAIELGGYGAYIWDARGRIYLYDLQQFDKAVSDLERTLEFAPTSQRYWFNYATALYKTRDCEAVSALRYYLNLCETQSCPADSIEWTRAWSEALQKSYKCRPPAPLGATQPRGE